MMRWCVETINTCSQTFFPYYNGFRYYIWVFWTLFFTSFYFSFTLTKTKRKNGRQIDYFDVTVCNLYQFVIILSLVVEKICEDELRQKLLFIFELKFGKRWKFILRTSIGLCFWQFSFFMFIGFIEKKLRDTFFPKSHIIILKNCKSKERNNFFTLS